MSARKRATATRRELIHGIADCKACGWRCENYRTVQRESAQHARETGHIVIVDLGYYVEYRRRAYP